MLSEHVVREKIYVALEKEYNISPDDLEGFVPYIEDDGEMKFFPAEELKGYPSLEKLYWWKTYQYLKEHGML